MGSINQKVSKFSFNLLSDDSSETIWIFGVIFLILLVINLLTSISPLVTGVLSSFISCFKPCFLNLIEIFPASSNEDIKFSAIFF